MNSSTGVACVLRVVLLVLSLWLYVISSSLSYSWDFDSTCSLNAVYVGHLRQWWIKHSVSCTSHTTIANMFFLCYIKQWALFCFIFVFIFLSLVCFRLSVCLFFRNPFHISWWSCWWHCKKHQQLILCYGRQCRHIQNEYQIRRL